MQSFLFTAHFYVHVLQTFDRHGERHDYGVSQQNLPLYIDPYTKRQRILRITVDIKNTMVTLTVIRKVAFTDNF
ncbi:hypothetical protein HaGV_gp162 [Helicoverpa armigera granulovirus]|uniref:Uncharacterized protein n=1 Tax=Helicoverpa armigera granulovirus TaxID=489830 RepID=A9YN04_9BBAC|nr:hypothetical protein HaGV_gp162 [Helicoverpa armigera granulovirus]ABY47853.1 unknown [Helicoverpa armigera granulovirus]